ncbi:MAG: GNAT family N-acetyltransferase [Rickettsiales bacterium]
MSVMIRRAVAADRDICIDFIGTLNGGPVRQGWSDAYDALLKLDRGAVYVAEDEEAGLLGVATVSFNLAIRYGGEYCQLEELYVDPKARGKNCGGLLLQTVIDEAAARGCVEVGLYITHRHAANKPFYEKYGFEDVGVEVRQKLR